MLQYKQLCDKSYIITAYRANALQSVNVMPVVCGNVLRCAEMHCTDTHTHLGNEVFDDVGRAVIGHVLTVDSDNMCEGLWVVLHSGSQQVG